MKTSSVSNDFLWFESAQHSKEFQLLLNHYLITVVKVMRMLIAWVSNGWSAFDLLRLSQQHMQLTGFFPRTRSSERGKWAVLKT